MIWYLQAGPSVCVWLRTYPQIKAIMSTPLALLPDSDLTSGQNNESANASSGPTLARETRHWQLGRRRVAGVDEAGRGALAGPVVAAAVVVPTGASLCGIWAAVRDSKQLKPAVRATLAAAIRQDALAWGVGAVPALEIDRIGIAPATRRAMQLAVAALDPQPHMLIIDWVRLPAVSLPQESFARADALSASVAAASILAKVHRDEQMVELDRTYPGYGFASHKGYGTRSHVAALAEQGPCPEHRHSFAPIARPRTLFETDQA